MLEKLAERFHTTPEVLKTLNPDAAFAAPVADPDSAAPVAIAAGTSLRVPNVGADAIVAADVDNAEWLATLTSLGVGTTQPDAERIEVSKKAETMKVFDAGGKLVSAVGAQPDRSSGPLPIGQLDSATRASAAIQAMRHKPAILQQCAGERGEHEGQRQHQQPVGDAPG